MRSASWRIVAMFGCAAFACARGACGPLYPCTTDSDCPNPDWYCSTEINACALRDCTPACGPSDECVAGGCSPRYADIRIQTPQDRSFVAGNVTVTAALDLNPGRLPSAPSTLTLTATTDGGLESGALAAVDGGGFTGVWMPKLEAIYALVASWPDAGLFSAPVLVTVDRTKPVFTLSIPTPTRPGPQYVDPDLPGSWRRDEFVPVTVTSTDLDVDPNNVQVIVFGIGDGGLPSPSPIAFNATPSTPCDASYCGQATLDLAMPDMKAFHGNFGALAVGRDLAGNAGSSTPTSLPVTRWKWVVDAGAPVIALALGQLGRVYVAVAGGLTADTMLALGPDGTKRWSSDAGTLPFGLTVSKPDQDGGVETAFFSALGIDPSSGDITMVIIAVNGSTGAQLQQCLMPTLADTTPGISSLTLIGTSVAGVELESVVGEATGGGGGGLLALRRGAVTGQDCYSSRLVGNAPVLGPWSVTADSYGDLFVGDCPSGAESWRFVPDGGLQLRWSSDAGGRGPQAIMVFDGGLIGGGSVDSAGTCNAVDTAGLVQLDSTTGVTLWRYLQGNGASSPAVATRAGLLIFGDDSPSPGLVAIRIGASMPSIFEATSAPVFTSPVIGLDGTLYAADADAGLAAYDSSLSPIWQTPLANAAQYAAPVLDCSRDPAGSAINRPGVMYLGTGNAYFLPGAGLVYATVVDSHGIDTQSEWPAFQHDPRSTGNAGTALSEFACP
jgi:hypothetical protein